MPKVTIKELQEKLKQSQSIIDAQLSEISRLDKELEDTKIGLNVVSRSEFNSVVTELENKKELYKKLEEIKDRETSRLKERVDTLINQLRASETERSESKTEYNDRGAGRKEFQNYDVVRKIYSLYVNGESLQGVANRLNEADIRTKTGGSWAKSSVRFILLNHSYVEKGIIDKITFNKVTERMKKQT